MNDEIRLIYIATRSLADPSRLNVEQTLSICADQNDPPRPQVDGSTQLSRRGQRKATTVHGEWYQGVINTPHIEGDQRIFWREYLDSTRQEEVHRIVHSDFIGWDADVSDLTIYRPLNTGSLTRFEFGDDYKANIQWRQIES